MKHIENGVHDISNAEYHGSAGLSRSALMQLKKSPYHYWFNYLSGQAEQKEPTPDMNIGSAVHTLVLEPNKFDDEFFITTQQTRPKKGTAPHQNMLFLANLRCILTPDEYQLAQDIAESVKKESLAMALLQDCKVEQSIYYTHKLSGYQCKSRPDAWLNGIVVDLKTSGDASNRAFMGSASTYGYYLQAGMMFRALESINQSMEQFVFIVVEKKPPYAVAIYTLSDEALAYGIKQFDYLMQVYARCKENDKWPGFGIRELSLPGWLKFDDEMEIE